MTTAGSALTVRQLSKRFEGTGQTGILDALDMTAPAGTLTLIVGAAGSGRSTLVRCLTGVYRPIAGEVVYTLGGRDAVDLAAADPRTVAWMRGHHIASFDGSLTAAPSAPAVAVVASAARRNRASALAALARLQIADLALVSFGRLRLGGRHAIALAAALLAERPFVILDEPERATEPGRLTEWLRHITDAGAAVVATGAPGSSLASIATVTGELTRGKIEWHKP